MSTRALLVGCALLLPQASPAIVSGTGLSVADVQSITTTIVYRNGDIQRNRGTGFVVGSRFFTAHHNIQANGDPWAAREIRIGGVLVEPAAVDVAHDLAVFDVPDTLCRTWCNDLELEAGPIALPHTVTWLQREASDAAWKRGRVSNLAFKSPPPSAAAGGCEHDLVVEIDQPFLPGSSGGPVLDADSGAVVGLIQGSFEGRRGQITGYYKPTHCVLARLQRALGHAH